MNRQIKKAVVAANLDELQRKSSEKFGKTELPQIHLDSDGTEIDDEDYFQTLEPNTDLIAVFSGERWIDVSMIALIARLQFKHTMRAKGNLKFNIDSPEIREHFKSTREKGVAFPFFWKRNELWASRRIQWNYSMLWISQLFT